MTIVKALGASGIHSGDTVYVGAGIYRAAVPLNMTSPTAETKVIADTDGSQTGDAGEVRITSYLTNDTTTPTYGACVSLYGCDYLTFDGFTFVGGGGANVIDATTSTSTNITFIRCLFQNLWDGTGVIAFNNATNIAAHWVLDSCTFASRSHAINLTLALSTGADYSLDFVIRNCFFLVFAGNASVNVSVSGSGSFKPGGITVRNSTLISYYGLFINTSNHSTSVPSSLVNSIFMGQGSGVYAATAGQITEDYNLFIYGTRTNVTAGGHSISSTATAPLLDFGQSWLNGFIGRPFLSPINGSPLLGFGNDGSAPSVDALNRPRPAGGGSTANAIGYIERHDTARIGSALGADAGGYIELVGPADHDFAIPVDAASTTISVKVTWDSNHGNTNKPQAILLAAPQIGVTTETKTATGTAGSAYETLTFTAQTPTAKGVVIVRLVSRAAAGNGIAAWDSFVIA